MSESPEPDQAADDAGAAEVQEAPSEPRRYPSTVGGLLYIGVLLVTCAAIAIAAVVSWRIGVRIMAATLCAAAALRVALRDRDAGMLAVRHKWLDASMLAAAGGLLFFLASSIPDQPS